MKIKWGILLCICLITNTASATDKNICNFISNYSESIFIEKENFSLNDLFSFYEYALGYMKDFNKLSEKEQAILLRTIHKTMEMIYKDKGINIKNVKLITKMRCEKSINLAEKKIKQCILLSNFYEEIIKQKDNGLKKEDVIILYGKKLNNKSLYLLKKITTEIFNENLSTKNLRHNKYLECLRNR